MRTCGEQSHDSQWVGPSAIQMLLSPARAQHTFEDLVAVVCADSLHSPFVLISS